MMERNNERSAAMGEESQSWLHRALDFPFRLEQGIQMVGLIRESVAGNSEALDLHRG